MEKLHQSEKTYIFTILKTYILTIFKTNQNNNIYSHFLPEPSSRIQQQPKKKLLHFHLTSLGIPTENETELCRQGEGGMFK